MNEVDLEECIAWIKKGKEQSISWTFSTIITSLGLFRSYAILAWNFFYRVDIARFIFDSGWSNFHKPFHEKFYKFYKFYKNFLNPMLLSNIIYFQIVWT